MVYFVCACYAVEGRSTQRQRRVIEGCQREQGLTGFFCSSRSFASFPLAGRYTAQRTGEESRKRSSSLSLSLFLSCFSTAYSLLLMAVRRGVGRSGSTACRVPTRPYNRGCPESCLAGANTLAERREALERGRESRKKEERATGERA